MGYRSVFVSQDNHVALPDWFTEKWGDSVHWRTWEGKAYTPIASKCEAKTYMHWLGLEEDLQRVVAEDQSTHDFEYLPFRLIWLHDDPHNVVLTAIRPSGITYEEPTEWQETDNVLGYMA